MNESEDKKMKDYIISFEALTTNDKIAGTLELKIVLPDKAFEERKEQALHRLCVEYARLNNVPCSFAKITSINAESEEIK